MASCTICGKKIGYLAPNPCGACLTDLNNEYEAELEKQKKLHANLEVQKQQKITEEIEKQEERNEEIEAVLLTTETVPNLNIVKRVEVISAEVAYGMNIFKDLFATVRDIVGGRSKAVQKTMRDARRTALYELKKEAHSVGANAVVAVDLDYVELSGGAGAAMVMLVATGTAVVIE